MPVFVVFEVFKVSKNRRSPINKPNASLPTFLHNENFSEESVLWDSSLPILCVLVLGSIVLMAHWKAYPQGHQDKEALKDLDWDEDGVQEKI